MKFTPEVIAALETLRKNAENDFELHRISVLENDLIAPPKVEIISEKYQTFNGDTFYKNKRGHYVHGNFLHRCVWEYHNGNIPENCHIHHRDLNKDNNNIENLQLLTEIEHHQLHSELTKKTFVCTVCGKEYVAVSLNNRNKFCSKHCEDVDRYRRHKVFRTCQFCGKVFETNKYSRAKCCSLSCGAKLRRKKEKTN